MFGEVLGPESVHGADVNRFAEQLRELACRRSDAMLHGRQADQTFGLLGVKLARPLSVRSDLWMRGQESSFTDCTSPFTYNAAFNT